jgi:hypothetical protein
MTGRFDVVDKMGFPRRSPFLFLVSHTKNRFQDDHPNLLIPLSRVLNDIDFICHQDRADCSTQSSRSSLIDCNSLVIGNSLIVQILFGIGAILPCMLGYVDPYPSLALPSHRSQTLSGIVSQGSELAESTPRLDLCPRFFAMNS